MSQDSPVSITVDLAIEQLQELSARGLGKCELRLPYDPGFRTIGAQPSLEFTNISAGFDWDQGKVFMRPAKPVGAQQAELAKIIDDQQNEAFSRTRSLRAVLRDTAKTPEERLAALSELIDPPVTVTRRPAP